MKKPIESGLDQELKDTLDSLRPVPARDPQLAARGRAAFLAEAASLRKSDTPIAVIPVSERLEKRHIG